MEFVGAFAETPLGALPVAIKRGLLKENYLGNCFTLVTRSPVKRTNTVFDGGCP